MHLPANGTERLQLDVSEAGGGIGKQDVQDRCLHLEDPLGPDLEEHLELPDRVCHGVGPDREVYDDRAQDLFSMAEFSHDGPTRDGLSYRPASAFR